MCLESNSLLILKIRLFDLSVDGQPILLWKPML